MQLGDSLYECFFFRKELDNYNSISIITFSEDLCVGSFFWLFSVPLPPTTGKFQWRLRKGRRPMKQPSWISSRTRWGCDGAWVDKVGFLTNVFSRNWHPKVILENHFASLKNQTNPIKMQSLHQLYNLESSQFFMFSNKKLKDRPPKPRKIHSTHVIGIYGDIGYVFIARGCRPKPSFCYYGWWKKSPLFTWFYTSQVVVWGFWTINRNTGKGDNPKYIKAVELLCLFVSFFQICGWRGGDQESYVQSNFSGAVNLRVGSLNFREQRWRKTKKPRIKKKELWNLYHLVCWPKIYLDMLKAHIRWEITIII